MGKTLLERKIFIASLGCAKNTVDSESMARLLQKSGYQWVSDPKKAAVIIVNTCGFIDPARRESLSVLHEFAQQKKAGQLLIAAGCLTQRYGQQVLSQVPGIDGLLGTRRWMDIVKVVEELRQRNHPEPLYHLPDVITVGEDEYGVDRVAIQGASAYIKIADGCRRPCAFCAIPLIKGTMVSRPIDLILEEARHLQDQGVREVNLIAQDTTDYGHDLGIKDGLSILLENLVKAAPGIDWIRVLYAYPGYVTDRLIEVMAAHRQIVPYLDMPLQHVHPATLKRMRRPSNTGWVYETLHKVRQALPDLALRTTFIVGYPQETEEEFSALMKFLEEIRFDRVGVFQFSFEPETASETLGDPVPAEVKQERYDRLMNLQQTISLQINQSHIGKVMQVLVEGSGDGISIGRSYRDAPEIDGLVVVEGEFQIGEMLPVRITGALPYDLSGEPATKTGPRVSSASVDYNDRYHTT